jgi:serine/threonine-protein kinase
MGVVYEVINTITGIASAVKRLSAELSISVEHREAFIREATDTMQFTGKSEYFVTTHTVDIDANGPFLVLEYVEHPTLRSIIEQHPDGLPVDAATNILHGLAYSLVELHRLGFVHRDLKPENVFVGPPADEPLVMLADFGLSKSHTERTRTSIRRAGTDRYISPEQRNGLETDATTDIFAFGIMAMEMLNGDVLSPGDSLLELRPEIPVELCEYITKCTKGRREQRPADSNELFDFFDALRSGSISPVYPPAIVHFFAKQPDVVYVGSGQCDRFCSKISVLAGLPMML